MASVPLPAGTGASSPVAAATCSSMPLILPSRIALDLSSDALTGFLIQNPADSSSILVNSSGDYAPSQSQSLSHSFSLRFRQYPSLFRSLGWQLPRIPIPLRRWQPPKTSPPKRSENIKMGSGKSFRDNDNEVQSLQESVQASWE